MKRFLIAILALGALMAAASGGVIAYDKLTTPNVQELKTKFRKVQVLTNKVARARQSFIRYDRMHPHFSQLPEPIQVKKAAKMRNLEQTYARCKKVLEAYLSDFDKAKADVQKQAPKDKGGCNGAAVDRVILRVADGKPAS
ncbi:MAG TPA: hypothetical protein VNA68_02185 [Candidatus Dormibacteraeota bacterium]|nr:hypothetical protein [Candidatus Dormibacteraeota bacterium]